jgi:hypothetical protein
MTAGSDAHTLREIGNYYLEMPEFNDNHSFLASLDAAVIGGKGTGFTTHRYSLFRRCLAKTGF